MEKHMKSHAPDNNLGVTNVEGVPVKLQRTANHHEQSHVMVDTGQETISFACNKCKVKLNDKENMKKHMKTHTLDNNSGVRNVQGVPVKLHSTANHHEQSHVKVEEYVRNKCKGKSNSQENMNKHMKSHVLENNSDATNVQGVPVKLQRKANHHERIHASVEKLACVKSENVNMKQSRTRTPLRSHTSESNSFVLNAEGSPSP